MKVTRFFGVLRVAGDVGVEVELEGRNLLKKGFDNWEVTADGSLRGEDNAEYVLRRPMSIQDLGQALEELKSKLEARKSVVDFSRRTSTHVHINCTGLNMIHLFNFITLLLIFEELLVDWCGEYRNGNLFCLQTKDADGFYEVLKIFAKKKNRTALRDNIRYSAINLAALRKYGSIEIRSLNGTIDSERVLTWVQVLLSIREKAAEYDNPIEIISDLSLREPVEFAKYILGDLFSTFFVGRGRKRKIFDGVRRAQDIAYCCDWKGLWSGEEVPHMEPGLRELPMPEEFFRELAR